MRAEMLRRTIGLFALTCGWCLGTGCPLAVAADQKVLLLAQAPDGHPRGTHEYRAGMRILAHCLKQQPRIATRVVSADGLWVEGPREIAAADCVVLFLSEGARWIHSDARRLEAFARHAADGKGLVCLHWGMGTRKADSIAGFIKLFGGCHGGPDRRYKALKTRLRVAASEHPICRGLTDTMVQDEFYYKLKFVKADRSIQSLLRARIDGGDETVAWAWRRADGGRSVGFSGLHFHRNWARANYRRLMTQGVLWTLKRKIDRPAPVAVTDALLELPPAKK